MSEERGVTFFPLNVAEQQRVGRPLDPQHRQLTCGDCGQPSNFRVICSLRRQCDNATIQWCVCACEREEPAVVVERGGNIVRQNPEGREFAMNDAWPTDLAKLFDEANRCLSAGAYTAAAMTARKLLMAVACDKGASDGKAFAEYVNYIIESVLPIPTAKEAIGRIREIGNEANHRVKFVSREEARRSLSICRYMLEAIYALPTA